ncbi:MAG: hypothetical protein Q9167_001082 [Letrouitia subvulpina]
MPIAVEGLERASTGGTQYPETDNLRVPSKSAQFRGSLVLNYVESPRDLEPPQNKARASEWVTYFKDGWDDVGVWKSAFIEMVATGLLCYLSGLIGATILNFDTRQAPAYAAVTDIFLLTLFIFAAGPGSGG